MSDFTITPAVTTADIDAVRKLCWDYRDFLLRNSDVDRRITETFYPVTRYSSLMRDLPDAHARPTGFIVIARDQAGTAVGCGMSHAIDSQTSEMKRVFVSEAARDKGLASALCQALMKQAHVDGFTRVVLDTSRSLIAAQRLYAGLGFSLRGPYQPIPDQVRPDLLFFEASL